ncbi:RNA ligase [Bailinhaonella thermotolerans]|nr:RNA ligase [Bailinhaonella thermotolerans]
MPKLDELCGGDLVEAMVREGMIARRAHPSLPLDIYCYTPRCQAEGVWNAATRACRGLVVDRDSGQVVARPFPKFFTWGQPQVPTGLTGPVTVADKVDGSLGILVLADGHDPFLATKASFTSAQAAHATAVYRARYHGAWTPRPGLTYLFEIVYPGNRIVVDYGARDDLILLGAVDIATGRSVPLPDLIGDWPGPAAELFGHASLQEALAAPPRPNREGLVVHFTDSDERIKIKQEDYVRLHRLRALAGPRTVWAHVAVQECRAIAERDGAPALAARLKKIPPDTVRQIVNEPGMLTRLLRDLADPGLTAQVETLARNLREQAAHWQSTHRHAFARLNLKDVAERHGRAAAARIVLAEADAALDRQALFDLLAGRDITAHAWRAVYPSPGEDDT